MKMEVDPDYAGFTIAPQENLEEEREKVLQENAREATVEKIKNIINDQFDKEIEIKENELMRINQKLADARCLMDRLRACVVASFYASSFTKPVDGAKGPEAGAAYHPAIQNVMRKAVTAVMSKNAPYKQQTKSPQVAEPENCGSIEQQDNASTMNESALDRTENLSQSTLEITSKDTELQVKEKKASETKNGNKCIENMGARQRIKKTVIVGNVSKYIPSDQREATDKSTHKWMVYVRGSKEEPRIDHFVRKVWFFLHPSYRPNDLVEVCEAPFHLTRRGWGEFPIRVQIHFCDRRNRPVDIIHGLRLDRTYTGLQTLGAETVCEVELDRSSVQLAVDDILEVSNLPNITPDDDDTPTEETKADPPKEQKEEHTKENVLEDEKTKASTESPVEEANQGDEAIEAKENDVVCTPDSPPSRKRKLDEGCEVDEDSEEKESKPTDADGDQLPSSEELPEVLTPCKRRRKRRRDGCRTSASEDEVLSDLASSATSAEEMDQEQAGEQLKEQASTTESVAISRTVGDPPNRDDVEETNDESNESSLMEIDRTGGEKSPMPSVQESANDSSGSSDASLNMKQPVIVLPRSPISGPGFFRMRSASDGEGVPSRSTADILKPAASVSSVINISVNQDQPRTSSPDVSSTGTPSLKKVTVLSPKSVIFQSKGTASQPIVLSTLPAPRVKSPEPNQDGPKPIFVLKKEPSESSGHITIPLSSLLRTSAPPPQVVKLAQPPVPSGQTFSVDMSSLGNQNIASKREKRSFSADHAPVRTLSLAPAGSTSGTQPPIQLHIINPQAKSLSPKKTKTAAQSVTLQTLQAALSSGNVTLSQPSKKQDESQQASKIATGATQQQFVLATVVNPKGKQHLALINPSTLSLGSTKKVITITSSKGKKTTLNAMKQAPVLKSVASKVGKTTENGLQPQKERIPASTKSEPIHKVLGDKLFLDRKVQSFEDDILPLVVKMVPLVNEKRDLGNFPFCAKSEADFLEWNVGKQRASEWQRACLVQKVLKYVQDKSKILQKCKLPSKKFIMNWCLRRGHSVFTDEYEEDTEEGNNDDVPLIHATPTMTTTDGILKLLEQKKSEQSKEDLLTNEEDDDVIFVDVVNVESPVKTLDVKQEPSEEAVTSPEKDNAYYQMNAKIQSFIESPEVSAVEEMTREIEVNLHRTYGMPACHLVLAKAFQQFTESLLRKSLSCTLKRRDGSTIQRVAPEQIKLSDVVGAICEMPTCDFLTDCNTASDSMP